MEETLERRWLERELKRLTLMFVAGLVSTMFSGVFARTSKEIKTKEA